MAEKKQLVLVIEDDELIAEALAEGLSRTGIKVLSEPDGEAGLKSAFKNHPDHIILDLMMPKKDGHEVLNELRQDKWGHNVPVTVLTNANDNIDIFMATKHHKTNYAIKSSMKLADIIKTIQGRLAETKSS
jgi:DNA-binding response OmpR family regulator